MSKAQPIRTRPDPPETLPGQTTTLVRADPGSAGESGTQWHPQLHAHLRELQLSYRAARTPTRRCCSA